MDEARKLRPKVGQTHGKGSKGAGDSTFERNNALLKLLQINFNNNDINSCESILDRMNCRLNACVENGYISWQQIGKILDSQSLDVCVYKHGRFQKCYDALDSVTQKWVRVLDVCNGHETDELKELLKGNIDDKTEKLLSNADARVIEAQEVEGKSLKQDK